MPFSCTAFVIILTSCKY